MGTSLAAVGQDLAPRAETTSMLQDALDSLGIPPSGDYVDDFREFVRWCRADDFDGRRRRGEAAFRIGDYGTALEDTSWCAMQRPEDPQAHLLLGKATLGAAANQAMPLGLVGTGGIPVTDDLETLLEKARSEFDRALQAQPANGAARIGAEAVAMLEDHLQEAPLLHH